MKFAQHEEVIALQEHVAELRERKPAFESTLHGVFCKHVVHREVLPCISQKVNHSETAEPLKVVQKECARCAREVKESSELCSDRCTIRVKGPAVKEVPLCRATRRISDHPRPTTDKRNRAATRKL